MTHSILMMTSQSSFLVLRLNVDRENKQIDLVDRVVVNKAETNIFKNQMPFSLEREIAKIKISVPLTELAAQDLYRS